MPECASPLSWLCMLGESNSSVLQNVDVRQVEPAALRKTVMLIKVKAVS